MIDFLPFALPEIGDEEISEVLDTLRSGWITTGPKTRSFEEDFAGFLGGGVEAVAVNSATAGLHLALEAVGVAPGDEVITTPYTFTATAEVVRYLGADPVFVDIDPATMNMDPDGIEAAVTGRTKAILPVHFAGLPCDMEPILGVARRRGLKVIEDAAHALPATYRGRPVGALGSDATVFSFYATKTITTGEGGMIATKDPGIANRCRLMRLHGISRDAFDRYTSPDASWYYEVVAPGYKYNMTDLVASLGIHQLRKAHSFRARRAALAGRYSEAFGSLPLILPTDASAGGVHAWHLYVIRLKDTVKMSRDRFIARMADGGIGCSVHFIPLHLHPYWRDRYRLKPDDFPRTLDAYQRAVSLPLYSRMSEADRERVIAAVRSLIG